MVTTVNDNSVKAINVSLFSLQRQIDALTKENTDLKEIIEKLTNRIAELEKNTNKI